jgi:hypothetical protein
MYGEVLVDGRASWASLELLQLLWTSSTMGRAYRHVAHVCELSILPPSRSIPHLGSFCFGFHQRDARLGNIFFYGYIIGGQNFVGNWRIAHEDASVPAWESAFTMSRRDD